MQRTHFFCRKTAAATHNILTSVCLVETTSSNKGSRNKIRKKEDSEKSTVTTILRQDTQTCDPT